jgi:hypothetical protein
LVILGGLFTYTRLFGSSIIPILAELLKGALALSVALTVSWYFIVSLPKTIPFAVKFPV